MKTLLLSILACGVFSSIAMAAQIPVINSQGKTEYVEIDEEKFDEMRAARIGFLDISGLATMIDAHEGARQVAILGLHSEYDQPSGERFIGLRESFIKRKNMKDTLMIAYGPGGTGVVEEFYYQGDISADTPDFIHLLPRRELPAFISKIHRRKIGAPYRHVVVVPDISFDAENQNAEHIITDILLRSHRKAFQGLELLVAEGGQDEIAIATSVIAASRLRPRKDRTAPSALFAIGLNSENPRVQTCNACLLMNQAEPFFPGDGGAIATYYDFDKQNSVDANDPDLAQRLASMAVTPPKYMTRAPMRWGGSTSISAETKHDGVHLDIYIEQLHGRGNLRLTPKGKLISLTLNGKPLRYEPTDLEFPSMASFKEAFQVSVVVSPGTAIRLDWEFLNMVGAEDHATTIVDIPEVEIDDGDISGVLKRAKQLAVTSITGTIEREKLRIAAKLVSEEHAEEFVASLDFVKLDYSKFALEKSLVEKDPNVASRLVARLRRLHQLSRSYPRHMGIKPFVLQNGLCNPLFKK